MTQVERVLHDVFHKSQCIFLPCQTPRSSCALAAPEPEGFINRFPDSVLLEIFAHLNPVELGVAAGYVLRGCELLAASAHWPQLVRCTPPKPRVFPHVVSLKGLVYQARNGCS